MLLYASNSSLMIKKIATYIVTSFSNFENENANTPIHPKTYLNIEK